LSICVSFSISLFFKQRYWVVWGKIDGFTRVDTDRQREHQRPHEFYLPGKTGTQSHEEAECLRQRQILPVLFRHRQAH
jgi:hypothetical protein